MPDSITSFVPAMIRWTLAIVVAAVFAPAFAQPRYGLSPDAYAVFSRWMTSSCLGDEALALQEALRRHRAELAPAFQRALTDGPPADASRFVRTAAESRYAELARYPVSAYRIEGVGAQALAQHARSSRQSYVADQVQRHATGYRSNAIAGLGIVGDAQTRAMLSRLATRRNDPLALAAAEASRALER